MESVSTGRRLNPRSESIDHFRTCREDFGIERNQSFKGDQGNAQFSLCCTSTAMPDGDSQDRHPAFCLEIPPGSPGLWIARVSRTTLKVSLAACRSALTAIECHREQRVKQR